MTEASAGKAPIVVGVDGSDASKAALKWAVGQAQLSGAPLEVILSWHVPMGFYGFSLPEPVADDVRSETRRELDTIIAEVVGDPASVAMTLQVVEGAPAPVLIEASEHASLLVVGNRGRGAFAGMLLGSVTQHCVANSACPVVVVREPDA